MGSLLPHGRSPLCAQLLRPTPRSRLLGSASSALGLRSKLTALLCPVLLLVLPCLASAQITNVTDDQSTPIAAAGHNYYGMANETVNPANGSVSFRLGVPVPPGRGLTMPMSFAYDSNGAEHVIPNPYGYAGGVRTSNAGFGTGGGWSHTLPMLTGRIRPKRCRTVKTYSRAITIRILSSKIHPAGNISWGWPAW